MIILLHNGNSGLIAASASVTVIIILICVVIMTVFANHKIKKIAEDLRYKESLFNILGSNVDEVFIICNSENRSFDYISPNFEKSIGYNRSILYQDHNILLQYVPEKERQTLMDIMNGPKITEVKQIEFKFDPMNTGKKRWLSMRVYPALENNNTRFVISIADITKEKEAKLLLYKALEKVKKANEAKKEFLSHMSHEIKTPINAIMGMTKIAQKDVEDKEKVTNCLNKINFASVKLLEIINNILDMSKIDSRKLTLVSKQFCLSELLYDFEALMLNQAEIQDKNFAMILSNYKGYTLIGDSTRLYQILTNCVSNALKFTPSGGNIRLEVSETGREEDIVRIRFIISDTGIGMSEEFLEHIFTPFNREDSSLSNVYGGTGLGMSIAKNLVMLMEGNINVESKKNQGTTVTVDIPFRINHTCTQDEQRKLIEKSAEPDFSGKRFLVVEDSAINREITCEFLKYLNIKVESAANGREAINLFEASAQNYYDGILMDIKMPGFDGYETAAAIRKSNHPDAEKICIIAMTADDFADENLSIKSGMNYHFTKPIDINKIRSLLHNA